MDKISLLELIINKCMKLLTDNDLQNLSPEEVVSCVQQAQDHNKSLVTKPSSFVAYKGTCFVAQPLPVYITANVFTVWIIYTVGRVLIASIY